jgi:hypothetical protein
MAVDEDVKGVLEELQKAIADVTDTVVPFYKNLTENDIVTSSLGDQARINITSAYALVSCYYVYLRTQNIEVDGALRTKISRVRDYLTKLKEVDTKETTAQSEKKSGKKRETRLRVDQEAAAKLVRRELGGAKASKKGSPAEAE